MNRFPASVVAEYAQISIGNIATEGRRQCVSNLAEKQEKTSGSIIEAELKVQQRVTKPKLLNTHVKIRLKIKVHFSAILEKFVPDTSGEL